MSRPAEACGGFWCSLQAPVNQTAEQIIFVDHPDETVTAIVQINYVGPSEKFAWVIPIPGDPKIEVSSNTAFARLDQATSPQYQVERKVEGTCKPQDVFFGAEDSASGGGPVQNPTGAATAPPIMVINQGSVGPYDYATIAVDPSLDEPADAAIDWFMNEGYDLTGVDADLLGPYLADGLNLLAFRLTKSANVTTGSIRPVMLTYESKLPMIPIRPTAVAAQDDMGIRVWVSGRDQAVPENYRSLVINEALIDWVGQSYQYFGGPGVFGGFGGTTLPQNYDAVVTEAANQAGGQGFVTELAGASAEFAETLLSATDEQNLDDLEAATYAEPIDAIWAANNFYRDWDGWRDAIKESVTLPNGTTIDDFASNPDAYRQTAQVDLEGFFDQLRTNVVGPIAKTKELVGSQPYLTRMYSTMSADEMNVDPAFNYNSDLGDVSRTHTALQFIECSADVTEYEAPWRIELPQGGVIRGEGTVWPIPIDALPANLKVVQLSGAGAGEVVEDNSGDIGTMLFAQSGGMTPSGDADMQPPSNGMMIGGDQMVSVDEDKAAMLAGNDPDASGGGESSGCAVAAPGNSSTGGWLAFGLAGVLSALVGRRRRRG
jgi:MYXO-CTERM domain-containing protein